MTVTVGNAVTLNASDKTYELDDRIVVYRDGGSGTDTLFTYDKDGKLIAGPVDVPSKLRRFGTSETTGTVASPSST